MSDTHPIKSEPSSFNLLSALMRFCIEQKLVMAIAVTIAVLWGVLVAPFDWNVLGLERDPVPVDAIPDIGENQQIVFTEWAGRSPQDIDDQITYPLTVALLGTPGVRGIRSKSIFGFSTISIVFEDDVEFYWSRSRVLEKINALPAGTLPEGVSPKLGPDATALGQVFWYTLEGRDPSGKPTGGWDPHELRSIQDFELKYKLVSVPGVSEVASIGGHVREYQIDVNPDAMRAAGISLGQIIDAVRRTNLDVGARTLEVNRAEYLVRGLGYIESVEDLERTAIDANDGIPILVGDIAQVSLGPAQRRGVLTKAGVESVGGVVVVRYGENPMATIQRVKSEIDKLASTLPEKTLDDGTRSRVTVVPFYDRSILIQETLQTLNSAIYQQVLVTIIVVSLMVMHLRSALLISAMLPLTVLLTFIAMKLFGVDANIVALSGIAIAIGTIVDMGIVLCENILRRLEAASPDETRLHVVYRASQEVSGAVLTAVATTVVGFLPVFTLEADEGKLFRPLAYTKTFALIASVVIALAILPAAAHALMGSKVRNERIRQLASGMLTLAGVALAIVFNTLGGMIVAVLGVSFFVGPFLSDRVARAARWMTSVIAALIVLVILASVWEPVGAESGALSNTLFIAVIVGGILLSFWTVRLAFPHVLGWSLRHKVVSLSPAVVVVILGAMSWLGFDRVFGWIPESIRAREAIVELSHAFPGIGSEFMPSLDEGEFLSMPTIMPHVSIGEATDILKELDRRIMSVPEVELAVGKLGRAETPLDPAPISMIETIIRYKSEYTTDESGQLVRQWRDEIRTPDDIWKQIERSTRMPGVTGSPKLQPIDTRIVMLQTDFKSPFGIKIYGPDLETIESVGLQFEKLLKEVPSIKAGTVFADRVEGKPYLEIDIDREKIARYGLRIADVQAVIEVAIGGKTLTMTVEGRERYPVRVRYLRELRDQPETLGDILVPTPNEAQIPLRELATIAYRRGPEVIKSEDTFLISYVTFDQQPGIAEVDVVKNAQDHLRRAIESDELVIPAGVSYSFAGRYESQVRAAKRLSIILPLSLAIIFLLIYFQFRSAGVTMMVFSGVFVAWGGGFLMLWLYAQPWFLNVDLLGQNLRELFNMRQFNLSVAVWVGFLALFGIATDDAVIMATRIKQSLSEARPRSIDSIRDAVAEGAGLRIRAAVMTSATTILALLPILTSSGRGSDIMIPMAIPAFGGMAVATITWFVVPLLYCWYAELRLKFAGHLAE